MIIGWVTKKYFHKLKIESYVLFDENFEYFMPKKQHLKWPWENCSLKFLIIIFVIYKN